MPPKVPAAWEGSPVSSHLGGYGVRSAPRFWPVAFWTQPSVSPQSPGLAWRDVTRRQMSRCQPIASLTFTLSTFNPCHVLTLLSFQILPRPPAPQEPVLLQVSITFTWPPLLSCCLLLISRAGYITAHLLWPPACLLLSCLMPYWINFLISSACFWLLLIFNLKETFYWAYTPFWPKYKLFMKKR